MFAIRYLFNAVTATNHDTTKTETISTTRSNDTGAPPTTTSPRPPRHQPPQAAMTPTNNHHRTQPKPSTRTTTIETPSTTTTVDNSQHHQRPPSPQETTADHHELTCIIAFKVFDSSAGRPIGMPTFPDLSLCHSSPLGGSGRPEIISYSVIPRENTSHYGQ